MQFREGLASLNANSMTHIVPHYLYSKPMLGNWNTTLEVRNQGEQEVSLAIIRFFSSRGLLLENIAPVYGLNLTTDA